jgi:hypothetical protein
LPKSTYVLLPGKDDPVERVGGEQASATDTIAAGQNQRGREPVEVLADGVVTDRASSFSPVPRA